MLGVDSRATLVILRRDPFARAPRYLLSPNLSPLPFTKVLKRNWIFDTRCCFSRTTPLAWPPFFYVYFKSNTFVPLCRISTPRFALCQILFTQNNNAR